MTVTIFMNMSADGFIAKNDDDVPFISDEEWDLYLQKVGKADALIVGRKTYELMKEAGDFEDLGNPRTVVMTNNESLKDEGNISFTHDTAASIVKALSTEGYKNIFVTGGAVTNSYFLKEKCVDSVVICISPYILGAGILFSADKDAEQQMTLAKHSVLDNGAILLEYNVKK